MAGGIYTEQKCSKCGQAMKPDANLECVCCPNPKHKKTERTADIFYKFDNRKFRVSLKVSQGNPVIAYRIAVQELSHKRQLVTTGKYDPRDFAPGNLMSFGTLIPSYIEDREKDISNPLDEQFRITRENWVHMRSDMDRFVEAFGPVNVKEVTFQQLRDFFRDMKTKPNPLWKNQIAKPAQSKTKKNVRTNLCAFYNWLVKSKVISEEDIPKIPTFKTVMGFRKRLTWEQQQEVLDLIKHRALQIGESKIYLGVKLCANTPNIRPGDTRHVRNTDVVITEWRGVRCAVVTINSHKTIDHTQAPKYGVFTPEDMEILDRLPKSLNGELPFFRWMTSRKGVKIGTPYAEDLFSEWFKKACEDLGYSDVRLYGGTRHTTTRILKKILGKDNAQHLHGDRTNEAFARYLEEDVDDLIEAALIREVAGDMLSKSNFGPISDLISGPTSRLRH